MVPWYIATEKFGPDHQGWAKYIEWSGLKQLTEVVSLDGMLNPTLLSEMKAEYWAYSPDEHERFGLFTDLAFLRREISFASVRNLLCVYLNPEVPPTPNESQLQFEFLGYDLVEVGGSTSALTQCGGFPKAFLNEELSPQGLLVSYSRAKDVKESLRCMYPEEHHADCDMWGIARAIEP